MTAYMRRYRERKRQGRPLKRQSIGEDRLRSLAVPKVARAVDWGTFHGWDQAPPDSYDDDPLPMVT